MRRGSFAVRVGVCALPEHGKNKLSKHFMVQTAERATCSIYNTSGAYLVSDFSDCVRRFRLRTYLPSINIPGTSVLLIQLVVGLTLLRVSPMP